ncbi:hypothetical protein [Ralstonia flaminis]
MRGHCLQALDAAIGTAVDHDPHGVPLRAGVAHGLVKLDAWVVARDRDEVRGRCASHRHGVMRVRPRAGFLASVRGVEAHVARLDTFDAPLDIEVERISGDGNNVLYRFTVRCAERTLLTGRAAVVLDASAV